MKNEPRCARQIKKIKKNAFVSSIVTVSTGYPIPISPANNLIIIIKHEKNTERKYKLTYILIYFFIVAGCFVKFYPLTHKIFIIVVFMAKLSLSPHAISTRHSRNIMLDVIWGTFFFCFALT